MNTKTVLTTDQFWDCDCSIDTGYIHPSSEPESCPDCGIGREDAPDSHAEELKDKRNFKKIKNYVSQIIKTPGLEQPTKAGLYLNLYHGREDLSKDMNNWGSEGPLIGPLTRLKVTYLSSLILTFKTEQDALLYGLDIDIPELSTQEDCVEFNGVYYGDWSIEFYEKK